MKMQTKSFKNFVRGISNDTEKSNYTEWLRNDIIKFAYLQKTIFNPKEYGELMELDEEQITDFCHIKSDYKKEQW